MNIKVRIPFLGKRNSKPVRQDWKWPGGAHRNPLFAIIGALITLSLGFDVSNVFAVEPGESTISIDKPRSTGEDRTETSLRAVGTAPKSVVKRWVPHVTNANGGFDTRILATNLTDEDATLEFQPYDIEGTALPKVVVTVGGNSFLRWTPQDLFSTDGVSHFSVTSDHECPVSVAYCASAGQQGGTAHVMETSSTGERFLLFPGEWDTVWDGMALINTGNNAAELTAVQINGQGMETFRTTINANLPAKAKQLLVLSSVLPDSSEDMIAIEATQPSCLVFLRGSYVESGASYLYQTLPIICPAADSDTGGEEPTGELIFWDKFSANLAQWEATHCHAWIEMSAAYIEGYSPEFYGLLVHEFATPIEPSYEVSMKMARVTADFGEDHYALFMQTDDIGSYRILAWALVLWPEPFNGNNWALQCFCVSASDAAWYLVDDDSLGYSPLIDMEPGAWNEIACRVGVDRHITIRVGDDVLYETDAVSDLQSPTVDITMGLVNFGCRTMHNRTVAFDDVELRIPSSSQAPCSTIPSFAQTKPNPEITACAEPSNLRNRPTLRELLGAR